MAVKYPTTLQLRCYTTMWNIDFQKLLKIIIIASYKSFTAFLAGSVFRWTTRLLSVIASFSCIYISQGSAATQLMRGGIFNNHFIGSCPQNVPVEEVWKSVNIWRRYRQLQSGTFFGTQCIVLRVRVCCGVRVGRAMSSLRFVLHGCVVQRFWRRTCSPASGRRAGRL